MAPLLRPCQLRCSSRTGWSKELMCHRQLLLRLFRGSGSGVRDVV